MSKRKNYSGRDLGNDFKEFFRKEKRRIGDALKALGCSNLEMNYGFYYFSGFFDSPSGQTYYFSCSDVRHFGYDQILYRTARDRNDFSGGSNQYVGTKDLKKMQLR